jgi:hypothetical protein
MGAGFGLGLLLALATSGAIAGERITRGAFDVAILANAATTSVAILATILSIGAHRSRTLATLVSQGLGAVVGIVLVHALLHREALAVVPWLSERPAQFVNDAVAVSGILALVWASADGLDTGLLVLTFLGITAYRATSSIWHLDHAPGGFHASVQELVVAQFVAAALALGLFRTALNRIGR